jgi:hypothetical protein
MRDTQLSGLEQLKLDVKWQHSFAKIMRLSIFFQSSFVSLFFKESRSGTYRCEYPYHVATTHTTLIPSCVKIMRQSKFYKRGEIRKPECPDILYIYSIVPCNVQNAFLETRAPSKSALYGIF